MNCGAVWQRHNWNFMVRPNRGQHLNGLLVIKKMEHTVNLVVAAVVAALTVNVVELQMMLSAATASQKGKTYGSK